MPKPAGFYSDRLRHDKLTKTITNGDAVQTWENNGFLWGSISLPQTGRRQVDLGAEQTGTDTEINLRGYPAVVAGDKLYAVEWAETWIVDSVARGDWELVATCRRYDEPTLEG